MSKKTYRIRKKGKYANKETKFVIERIYKGSIVVKTVPKARELWLMIKQNEGHPKRPDFNKENEDIFQG